MTPATALTNELLIEIGRQLPHIWLWRNNTGGAVGMATVKKAIGLMSAGKLKEAAQLLSRPVKFGLEGSPDLVGAISPSGRLLGVEVKAGADRQSDIQKSFQRMLVARGGAYVICRNVADCVEELRGL